MRLQPWQRYRKANPCPVCGGYSGAHRKENRCKGWRRYGGGYYCERDNGTVPLPLFVPLWFYKEEDLTESLSVNRGSDVHSTVLKPPLPPEPITVADPPSPPERRIVEEVQVYLAQGEWKPAETKVWYVVMEGSREVTRSLKKEVASAYL